MYCPQCSQEQVSEEMRFCSRCGFPLAIVSQLVRNGGQLAGFEPEAKRPLSPRQRAVRWGVMLMLISVLLVPLSALMTALEEEFFVLFIPVSLIFVFGLARLLHAYLFSPKTRTENASPSAAKTSPLPGAYKPALPAGQTIPVTNWRRPINTSEMAQPLSVTESTTRLLDDSK
jgi:hypothetical protein